MKNLMKLTVALGLILTIAGVCWSAPSSKIDELDAKIREASNYLNERIPEKMKIAVISIQSDSGALSEYIIDELISNAVNDNRYSVVDRHQLDAARSEINFNSSGEVSDKSAQAVGKFTGAQIIVTGRISKIGKIFRFSIRALEVESVQVTGSKNIDIASKGRIVTLMASGSGSSAASGRTATTAAGGRAATAQATTVQTSAPATSVAPATPPPPPAVRAYKIGDTGPAGGLIFYDKGNNSGGWRYLEAASVEAEFLTKWSVRDTEVGTQETIGSGKRNTQLIVEKFRQTSGEWDTAAQKCDDLELGGFDDWFLPSKDELDQMYGNLKRRNLGEFKNETYWSSSENSNYYNRETYYQRFSDGRMSATWWKNSNFYVRPIRQVPGP